MTSTTDIPLRPPTPASGKPMPTGPYPLCDPVGLYSDYLCSGKSPLSTVMQGMVHAYLTYFSYWAVTQLSRR